MLNIPRYLYEDFSFIPRVMVFTSLPSWPANPQKPFGILILCRCTYGNVIYK
jgi:hypothetical protein